MKLNRLNVLCCALGCVMLLDLSAAGRQAQAREVSYGTNTALSGRLAELNIVDRTAGYRLPVYWYQGKAYVVGNPGNEYEVSLASRTSGDLLAVISVDGVNAVSGQTASSQQSGYVFSGWENYSIRGWRKSQEQTAAFYFTALSDSYAGRTGRPDNVGVIGVALFQRQSEPVAVMPRGDVAESKPGYPQPPQPIAKRAPMPMAEAEASQQEMARAPGMSDMPSSKRRAEVAESSAKPVPDGMVPYPRQRERLGTGHGRIEDSRVDFVEFKRATSQPAEVLTIYYDSYANLVARGVIPARPLSDYERTCAGGSRQAGQAGCARPFPKDPQAGFVADPPR